MHKATITANSNSVIAALLVLILCMGCAAQKNSARIHRTTPWLGASNGEVYVVVTVRNPRVSDINAGSTSREYDSVQAYGPSARARSDMRTLATRYSLRSVNSWPIDALTVHCVVFAAQPNTNIDELIARMRSDKLVESVQPLNSFATLASAASGYSDPYFNLQSNLQTLQVPQAQRVSRGAGVRVAIIDTGIDVRHPDLQGRVQAQRNYVGAAQSEPERHGTAVAGVIAALANNKQGIVGIAPAAQLLALRACWPAAPNDARAMCNTFTLAQALSAAIELRADVVNLSLGGPADPLLTRLVVSGMQQGIIYVGAVPPTMSTPTFPASTPGVISVDTSDSTRERLRNGPLFAPGENILTLTPAGGYDFMSGSSLAAASVSGGVALLLAHRRNADRNSVYAALAKSDRSNAAQKGNSIDLCIAMTAMDARTSCRESGATE
jgi:Subtilase family